MFTRNFLILCLLASGAQAVSMPAPVVIAPGTVLCLTLKDAQKYQQLAKGAPQFAADLIDRAACYVFQGIDNPLPLASSGAFQQYQLLSGQKVWAAKP